MGIDHNNPFIEVPDEHEPTGDALLCWMPGADIRECSPACVAYEERFLDPESGLGPCMILNSLRSVSASVSSFTRRSDVDRRVRAMESQPVPPKVK